MAEAVKLTENIFRAVNIAMVNELKVVYAAMGTDIWDVIEAAKTKPFGFMPFYLGPGLGGHCIPIDPFYLTWKARKHGQETRFIELAGEVNTAMPAYGIRPSRDHAQFADRKSIELAAENISGFDLVLVATHHETVDWSLIAQNARLVVDSRNALSAAMKGKPNYFKA